MNNKTPRSLNIIKNFLFLEKKWVFTLRKIISRGANFVAGFFLKPVISDMTGSFRLYKRDVILDLIKQIKSSGYAFQMEIIIRAQYNNLKIEEIGINFVDRLYGKSKLGMKK